MALSSIQIKIIAVVIVVAVVATGATVLLMNNNNNKGSSAASIDSQLMVRGNSNNDYTINNADLDIANDIIKGTKTLTDYPLADANNDGTVDSNDVALINQLIKRESTTAYVVCLDRNGKETSVAVNYPMKHIVPFATNIIEPLLDVGGGSACVGYFASTYKVAEKSMNDHGVDFGSSKGRTISADSWQKFTQLDHNTEGGIDALIADYSGVSAITDSYASDLADAGIALIIYAPADAYDEITAALTLGFLLGGDCEKYGVKYAQISWNISDYITDKVKNLTDSQKQNYICLTMGIYICQNESTFNVTPQYAGGIQYYKTNETFEKAYAGSSSTKMASTEALSNYDNAQHIISNRSVDYGLSDIGATGAEYWDKYVTYFQNLADYKDLVYVNNLLPGIVRLAYIASILYPDIFSEEWADSVLQQFIDGFIPLNGQTTSTILTTFTYDDYQKAKAATS
jgi:iron complex transport system substrate-binding protein